MIKPLVALAKTTSPLISPAVALIVSTPSTFTVSVLDKVTLSFKTNGLVAWSSPTNSTLLASKPATPKDAAVKLEFPCCF